jgi:hypothetical protein
MDDDQVLDGDGGELTLQARLKHGWQHTSSLGAAFHFTYSGRQPPNLPGVPKRLGHDGQKEDNMTNNILKLAQQARTNAQLLTVSQGGIRSLTREDALKTRGDVVEAIRRLQVFEKDLAKKLDT